MLQSRCCYLFLSQQPSHQRLGSLYSLKKSSEAACFQYGCTLKDLRGFDARGIFTLQITGFRASLETKGLSQFSSRDGPCPG